MFLCRCEQLHSMRRKARQQNRRFLTISKARAAAWEEQAGRTLLLDKTLEYVRTPHVQHTANEWQKGEHEPIYPQQPGISDELPHLREHPLRQRSAEIYPVFMDAYMERAHQQPKQEPASEDCRTR